MSRSIRQRIGGGAARAALVLLATSALVPVHAADVVMRRPLQSSTASSSTPTPGTPTPGTPTPTPGDPDGTPTPTPTGETFSAYVATQWCEGDGYHSSCWRGDYVDGVYSGGEDADPSFCASQAANSQWARVSNAAAGGTAMDPSMVPTALARDGQPCSGDQEYHDAIGATCNPDGTVSCSSVHYWISEASLGGAVGTDGDAPTSLPLANCDVDQHATEADRKILAQFGMIPAASGISARCQSADLYGAKGACTQKVTYDTGWPTPPASAHVNADYVVKCYAIFDPQDPASTTITDADVSKCTGQHLTSDQAALLAQFAPDLVDYNSLDRTCDAKGGVQVHYERAGAGSGGDPSGQNWIPDQYGGDSIQNLSHSFDGEVYSSDWEDAEQPWYFWSYQFDYTFDVPYVCTDNDNYFDGTDSAFKDSFSMGDSPCREDHVADMNNLQRVADQQNADYQSQAWQYQEGDPEFPQWKFPSGSWQPEVVTVTDDPAAQVIHIRYQNVIDNECGNGWEDPEGACQ